MEGMDVGGSIEHALRFAAILPLYFVGWGAVFFPFVSGLFFVGGDSPLVWPPTVGLVCLLVGVVLGLRQAPGRVLILLLPASLAHLIAAIGGFFAGSHDLGPGAAATGPWSNLLAWVCGVGALLLIGYLVFRSKPPRLPWVLIGLFDASYVVFAVRLAIMPPAALLS